MATSLSPGKTCVGILFESTTSDLQMTTISGYPMIELFLGWMRMKLLCPINPLKKKINHVLDFYMIFWETIRNSKRVILIFDTPQFIKIILSGLWRLFPIFCSNVVIFLLKTRQGSIIGSIYKFYKFYKLPSKLLWLQDISNV